MQVHSIELRTEAGPQQILLMTRTPITVEEYKKAYNEAYNIVSSDDSILSPLEELEAVAAELIRTGKFEIPRIVSAVVMEDELTEANHIENNIISYDEEFTGFTQEELDKMSKLFKDNPDGNPCD